MSLYFNHSRCLVDGEITSRSYNLFVYLNIFYVIKQFSISSIDVNSNSVVWSNNIELNKEFKSIVIQKKKKKMNTVNFYHTNSNDLRILFHYSENSEGRQRILMKKADTRTLARKTLMQGIMQLIMGNFGASRGCYAPARLQDTYRLTVYEAGYHQSDSQQVSQVESRHLACPAFMSLSVLF